MSIPLQEYAGTFAKYVGKVKSAYLKPFRDEIKGAWNESKAIVLKRELSQKLWGGSGRARSGAPRFLFGAPRVRFSRSETAFVGGFKVSGMPALMIKGGKTEPHVIEPKGRFLSFRAGGGKDVFAQAVRHPGSRVRPTDIITPVLEKRAARFDRHAVAALDKLAQETFR